jgi:hypothetical protein
LTLLAILAALALEQWHAPGWRVAIERAFVRHAHRLERLFNGGTATQGAVAAAIAIVPPVAVAGSPGGRSRRCIRSRASRSTCSCSTR